MGHTYTKAHFHIVFSTKSRQKLIAPSVQPRLWAYMVGICSNVGIVSKALNLLKSNSSGWMIEQRRGFGRQEGYGAFAVSVSNLAAVKRYVLNQQAHHRKMTFEDEFIALLEKHVCNTSQVRLRLVPHLRRSILPLHLPSAYAPG